jgi:type I restriction enzyme, R subunit
LFTAFHKGRRIPKRARVETELRRVDLKPEQRAELTEPLSVIQTTDMAVVVSPAQNEIEQIKTFGIDAVPHRKRMRKQPLDEKFKDPDDPFRLVFVCAIWLTGFDAPSCSTIYLDKPMRNHTLMQTIARANRVYPGKQSGVIVDYANVFASLEKALAIYGKGRGGETPVRDKNELAEELRQAVADASRFCEQHGVDLAKIDVRSRGLWGHSARDGSARGVRKRYLSNRRGRCKYFVTRLETAAHGFLDRFLEVRER